MKLIGKIVIKGNLETQTGLHLGGSKSSLTIGGIDNSVIKTAKGVPYIPGSSIKGKLRSLLASVEGSLFFSRSDRNVEMRLADKLIDAGKGNKAQLEKYKTAVANSTTDEDCDHIIELFGRSGDSNAEYVDRTRLLVRDAFLQNEEDKGLFKNKAFTDSKWENVIDRKTGTALNPRQLERVPVGARFGLELVYNIYDEGTDTASSDKVNQHLNSLLLALQLLQDDGIGGSISRGYGKVKVAIEQVDYKLIDSKTMKYETLQPVNETQQLISNLKTEFASA